MKVNRISSKEIAIQRNDEGGGLVVEGYAAVYDAPSKELNAGGKTFIERIQRGAFDEVVRNLENQSKDCVATFQHDRNIPLARTSSGTLSLESDDVGLKFRFEVPKTTLGKDVEVMLERGDLSQCSFVATAAKDDIAIQRDSENSELWRQEITNFRSLYDISLVVDPAYEQTHFEEVSRSIEELEKEEIEARRALEEEVAKKESQIELLNNLIERSNES